MQFSTTLIAAVAGVSIAMAAPALESRVAHGACGVHVVQYQKNENGIGGEYEYTIILKDAIGATVGGVDHQAVADRTTYTLDSQLPYSFGLTSGTVDSDPVMMTYNGQHWESSNGCSTGAYDSGSRQMDCGFTC